MSTDASRAGLLETARYALGLSLTDLWLDYVGLGGSLRRADLGSYLEGTAAFGDHDHDMVVQALNEHFMDTGEDHPLPYADELPSSGHS